MTTLPSLQKEAYVNRQIKFRAWDKENKRMGEVSTLQFHRPWATKDEDGDWIDVFEPTIEVLYGTIEVEHTENEVEIMQYTGLKDKNGKEIYESDYVALMGVGEKVEVMWSDEEQGWMPKILKGDTAWEVVGNVYEGLQNASKGDIMTV